jgi:hypothetical protein
MANFPVGLFEDSSPRNAAGWLTDSFGDGGAYRPSTTSNAYNLPSDTARSNLAASPFNVELSDLVNATNRAAQSAANASRLGPAGQAVQSQILGNIGAGARGELSPGAVSMMAQGAAERGIRGGFGSDSPNINASYLRALGLTSEDLQAKAAQQYGALLGENPSAPIYSPSTGFISPSQYASVASAQNAANAPRPMSAPRVSFPGGGGGGYTPSAAEYNTAGGGGYPGSGYSGMSVPLTDEEWASEMGGGTTNTASTGGGLTEEDWYNVFGG